MLIEVPSEASNNLLPVGVHHPSTCSNKERSPDDDDDGFLLESEIACHSGYLADSESQSNQDPYYHHHHRHHHDCHDHLQGHNDALPCAAVTVIRKKTKSPEDKPNRVNKSSHCRGRRRSDRRHYHFNGRWIERIFSNTPFRVPDDFTVTNDPESSSIRWNTTTSKQDFNSRRRRRGRKPSSSSSFAHASAARENVNLSSSSSSSLNESRGEREGIAGSLMQILNDDSVDDEVLTSTLISVLGNLLKDSYKVQATYRSYSFNGVSSPDDQS